MLGVQVQVDFTDDYFGTGPITPSHGEWQVEVNGRARGLQRTAHPSTALQGLRAAATREWPTYVVKHSQMVRGRVVHLLPSFLAALWLVAGFEQRVERTVEELAFDEDLNPSTYGFWFGSCPHSTAIAQLQTAGVRLVEGTHHASC